MEPKTRILFVDDESSMLELLRLMMRTMADEWESSFVQSGAAALESMEQQPFDVIVTDMRMPQMTGAQLLNQVMRRYPQTVRIVLSAYADERTALESIGATHQWLQKPCPLPVLKSAVSRIHGLNRRLQRPEVRLLAARLSSLPSIPSVYFRMLEALESCDVSVETIGAILAEDPGLTAKVLQLVNSAFFGFARPVANGAEAVQLLGVGRILSLALAVNLFAGLEAAIFKNLPLQPLLDHSLLTGLWAGRIVQLEGGDRNLYNLAFTGGLLHDVGKLVLATNLPDPYRQTLAHAERTHVPLAEHEQNAFGATHADVGGYLLGIWGLPVPLVEAVALHHEPSKGIDTNFSPLTAIHVANALAVDQTGAKGWVGACPLDHSYLTALGLQARVPVWHRNLTSPEHLRTEGQEAEVHATA
ncbi:MAG: HDOD domain-containing protein [Verrucomicrobia bacterium]|nr:HDOD domain-containing protein [Verrucomicrobiota bacterium]